MSGRRSPNSSELFARSDWSRRPFADSSESCPIPPPPAEWDQTLPDWEIDVELCQEGGQPTLPFDVERRREREWKGKEVVFRKVKTRYMKQFDVETEMSGQADACTPGRRDRGLAVSERPKTLPPGSGPTWADTVVAVVKTMSMASTASVKLGSAGSLSTNTINRARCISLALSGRNLVGKD